MHSADSEETALFDVLFEQHMFNPSHFNAREQQFIRIYVARLRDEYFLVKSVLELMHPKNLGVHDVVAATRLATGLAALHEDFIDRLNSTHKKNGRKRLSKDYPTVTELADLFTLSFFKIITTSDKQKTDIGFFSGDPNGWKKPFSDFVKHEVKPESTNALDNIMSAYIAAMQKLFPNIKWAAKFFDNHEAWKLPPNSFNPAANSFDDKWLAEEEDDFWPDDDEDTTD